VVILPQLFPRTIRVSKSTLSVTDNRTGKTYELPIQDGTIRAVDLRQIKVASDDAGLATYDPGFLNTAACRSAISYIDGDKGILRYRGYPIEQLAERSTFLETAYLLLHGELPSAAELESWVFNVTHHTIVHESIKKFIDGFHHDAHPMGVFVSTVAALSTFYPEAKHIQDEISRRNQIFRLIAKTPTLAAFAHRHSVGMPYTYPDNDLSYAGNFLNMMFKATEVKYTPNRTLEHALELERIALQDDYFVSRKLYPNVDFYSGIIYEAMKFPMDMFPVLFAIGRTPGWLAQWQEMLLDKEQRIARPRQIYTGAQKRDYLPIEKRTKGVPRQRALPTPARAQARAQLTLPQGLR